MDPLHARYPFLDGARDAVDTLDESLGDVLARDDDPVVERAVERVTGAVESGEIPDAHPNRRVELLSYPIARVLVSAVDEPILVRRFAEAEARQAIDRFQADRSTDTGLKSTSAAGLTLEDLLREFSVAEQVRSTGDGYRIRVDTYLRFAADIWGDQWRLVNRTLHDGWVRVASGEMTTLLREAIADRVGADLPLSVPEAARSALDDEIADIEALLAELELTRDIDTVVPERFPPCMSYLLDQIRKGEHLEHHSRFAITAFLTNIGLSTDEIVDLYMINSSFGEEMTRYQTDHIRGETSPTEYTAPSCATMQSYGDCVNMDDRCETIAHPLSYYERALDEGDEDLLDWRERDHTPTAEAEDGDGDGNGDGDEDAGDTGVGSETDANTDGDGEAEADADAEGKGEGEGEGEGKGEGEAKTGTGDAG